jgi:hypothetical protein
MRDIKFRKWEPVNARMIDWTEILQGWYANVLTDNYIMQYTGMKDKNNQEIWEGDILRSPNGILHAVEYMGNGFYLDDITNTQFDEDYLVVGNIYQNPDLLSVK